MIKILIKGEALDLPEGFSMAVEDTNPIFNDQGSQSIPATVPPTRRNNRLTSHVVRVDNAENPNEPERTCIIENGAYQRRGTLNYTSANSRDGITFNVGFDNSTAYEKWKNKKLTELSTLPMWRHSSLAVLMSELNEIYHNADPKTNPLAVFPIVTAIDSEGWLTNTANILNKEQIEMLNMWTRTAMQYKALRSVDKVTRTIDGTVTEVSVPENYGFTPFVRVWRVLELIFSDLGMSIAANPFKTDNDLARLVVLNNCADSCCQKDVNYIDLMPDVTVEAFMAALWARFGLVYHVDFSTCRVTMAFIGDIINKPAQKDLSNIISEPPVVNYDKGKYIKLSASTSIDCAEPETERFEDFFKNFDSSQIGDSVVENENIRFTFYRKTAVWSRYDKVNRKSKEGSTSFFNWDPKTPGVEAEEITSDDEFVPLAHVQIRKTAYGTYGDFADDVPFYLKGMRHNHSYIKGSDGPEGGDTPLAFMFAFTGIETSYDSTEGRFASVTGDTFKDGKQHTTSLLFQYKGGLFDKYWRQYDEILRHGARTIEIKGRLKLQEIQQLDMFRPVMFKGVRCLIDTVNYSLPGGKEIAVEIKLRTIQTQGTYNIATEQNIPNFTLLDTDYYWKYVSDTLQTVYNSTESKNAAIKAWKNANPDYQAPNIYTWPGLAMPVTVQKTGLTWESDPYNADGTCNMEGATRTRQYQARATYEIWELYDVSEGDPDHYETEPGEIPLGQITITITYTVTLVSAHR